MVRAGYGVELGEVEVIGKEGSHGGPRPTIVPSPRTEFAGALPLLQPCSLERPFPAIDGPQRVEASRSRDVLLDEEAELSDMLGIPPSNFDGGCVVNSWLPAGSGGPCPLGGSEGLSTVKPERRWSSFEEGRDLLWSGEVPTEDPAGREVSALVLSL